jgi:hypothetical protein
MRSNTLNMPSIGITLAIARASTASARLVCAELVDTRATKTAWLPETVPMKRGLLTHHGLGCDAVLIAVGMQDVAMWCEGS